MVRLAGGMALVATFVEVASAQPSQPSYRVTHDTYGCANPRATIAITNVQDPRRSDPGWVNFVIADGHCAPITPRSQWRLVFREGNLAYMTYAGTTGLPGSFYLRSDEIVEIAGQQPSPTSTPARVPEELNLPATGPVPLSSAGPIQPPPSPVPWAPAPSGPPVTNPAEGAGATDREVARGTPAGVPKPSQATATPSQSQPSTMSAGARAPEPQPAALSSPPAARALSGNDIPGTSGNRASPTTSQSSPSGPAGMAVLAVLAAAFWIFTGRGKKTKAKGRREQSSSSPPPRSKPMPPPWGAASKISVPAARAASVPVVRNLPATWYPRGTTVTVAGHVIREGMVYVGTTGFGRSVSPCFIDPGCEVARSDPDDAGAGMSYWPSYSAIGPRSRLAYLRWLMGGRSDPKANVGYVFLYFYGLERRLFVDRADRAEADAIVAEVERLRGIYGTNNSFRGYSTGLLDAVKLRNLLDGGDAADGYRPDLDGPLHSMPMGLKLAIASRVAAGRPLSFELAMAGLFGLEPGLLPFGYPVLAHARPQLLELMRPKFEAACPLGFKLANRKDSKLHLSHRCATAGLVVDIGASADGASLPDPASLTWTKLVKLVEPVAAELEPFAKMKAYRPARVASLSVFTALPGGVASTAAGAEAKAARDWLEHLPKPIARVGFAELAQRALGETSAKWTLRHHRAVGDALAATEYGVEPHPNQGGLAIANDTSMFVFRDPAAGRERTSSFRAAAVGAEVVAAVSRVDPGTASAVNRTWLSRIGERLPLEPTEITRLDARLRWLEGSKPSMGRIKAGLASVSETERETVAWSAATAAAAGGVLARDQVSVLEKVYDTLGLTRRGLYTALHGAAADGARPATEPVAVARGEKEIKHAIPRPPLPVAGHVAPGGLDEERIRVIKAETERVNSVLSDIFVEDGPRPASDEVPAAASAYPGLDASHARLVEALGKSPTWTRPDFEREARACDLLPDGALETINEWAFDRFGDALIQDGDVMVLDADLLARSREPENAE